MIKHIFREAKKPEPTEKIEVSGGVKWGDDNLYPQFLNGLKADNPIHGGIINQKVKFITSGGVDTQLNDKTLLDNIGGTYSIAELFLLLCHDAEIGDSWCVIWKKNLATGKWIPEFEDFELIRATENGIFFEYSENWLIKVQNEKTNFRRIKSIEHVTDEDTECIQVQITRPKQRLFESKKIKKQLSSNYYPTVGYSGAITDILSSIEMSYFTYSEVVNGWKGGTLINLANGIPATPELRKQIEDDIKDMATDRDIQGGVAITFSDGKEREPSVSQINGNDLDKRYDQSKKSCRDAILVAHGVISPSLFAVFTESLFGSKEEMLIAYLLFKETYVVDRQKNITAPFNWAYEKLNGFDPRFRFNDYTPSFLLDSQTEVMKKEFSSSKEKEILSLFSKHGRSRSECKLKKSSIYESYEDNEQEFKRSFLSGKFADSLSDVQRTIVTMINNGESYDAIMKATELTSRQLSNHLITLKNLNYIESDWKVTESGKDASLTEAQLEVLYSYELRPDAPALVEGGESREFCRELISLDRLYTRDEINTISSAIGRDVWRYRGGWYHNPETNKNTPSCRHTWFQNISVNF